LYHRNLSSGRFNTDIHTAMFGPALPVSLTVSLTVITMPVSLTVITMELRKSSCARRRVLENANRSLTCAGWARRASHVVSSFSVNCIPLWRLGFRRECLCCRYQSNPFELCLACNATCSLACLVSSSSSLVKSLPSRSMSLPCGIRRRNKMTAS
jgi:hypothetical protein